MSYFFFHMGSCEQQERLKKGVLRAGPHIPVPPFQVSAPGHCPHPSPPPSEFLCLIDLFGYNLPVPDLILGTRDKQYHSYLQLYI